MSLEKNEAMGHFVRWLYEHIRPHLGRVVVEAGAGIGTYSQQVFLDKKEVYAVEYSDEYVQLLKKKYGHNEQFHIIQADIASPTVVEALKGTQVDSLFSLNVLEHVMDDQKALENFFAILPPGGAAVVLVPAHHFLFNSLDTAVGHHRRYSKKELREKVVNAGFEIDRMYYFNFPAIVGWYLNGNILRKEKIDPGATRAFNVIVPVAKWIENHLLRGTMGISLIAVLKKPLQ